jgi:hypothetical protein
MQIACPRLSSQAIPSSPSSPASGLAVRAASFRSALSSSRMPMRTGRPNALAWAGRTSTRFSLGVAHSASSKVIRRGASAPRHLSIARPRSIAATSRSRMLGAAGSSISGKSDGSAPASPATCAPTSAADGAWALHAAKCLRSDASCSSTSSAWRPARLAVMMRQSAGARRQLAISTTLLACFRCLSATGELLLPLLRNGMLRIPIGRDGPPASSKPPGRMSLRLVHARRANARPSSSHHQSGEGDPCA